jgi:antitoxin component of RelBE/YafQ-DinJ toxin-antitoxin module
MGKRDSLLGVRLDDAERKALASAAEERGIGVSPLVRMVLRAWLREHGHLKD